MKKRKPAPKLPAPKPAPRPQPSPSARVAAEPAPNFDSAMAQQVYSNILNQAINQSASAQRGGIMLSPPPLPTNDQLNSMIDPNRKYSQEAGTMYDQFGRSMNYANSGQRDALQKLGFISQSNYDFIRRENPNLSAENALKNYNLAQLQSMGRTSEQANQELGKITASAASMQQIYPQQQTQPQVQQPNPQQAMQNYQNFLSQGTANYQAAMQQPFSPAMPKPMPAPKKPSTSSFQTPRPFG